jgi:Protein of unknown function (DUF4079)
MQYPLIGKQLLLNLRWVHAFYNGCVLLLVLYHGWLGGTIRRARRAKAPLPFAAIKRHRKTGPVLVILGVTGFFIGFTLVLLHTGNVLEYPPHFFTGLAVAVLLVTTWRVSRKIKGSDSPYRTPHFIVGIIILCLYLTEAVLGLGVLFNWLPANPPL